MVGWTDGRKVGWYKGRSGQQWDEKKWNEKRRRKEKKRTEES